MSKLGCERGRHQVPTHMYMYMCIYTNIHTYVYNLKEGRKVRVPVDGKIRPVSLKEKILQLTVIHIHRVARMYEMTSGRK